MTPKMQEALEKLAAAGSLPKSAFHHSTVAALLKGGHVEEVPGDAAWITAKVADPVQVCPCGRLEGDAPHKRDCPVEVAALPPILPCRDPARRVIPIDEEVIASVEHDNTVYDMTRTAFCAVGTHDACYGTAETCSCGCHHVITSRKMPMVADPAHLPGCEATLPQVAVPGYRWRWFDPQGGQSVSATTVQLMADGDDLSPSATLLRNADGTWRAERGHRWGMSALIAGTYQGSLSMEECARAVAVEAALRGASESIADESSWTCRGRIKPTCRSRRRAQRGAMAR